MFSLFGKERRGGWEQMRSRWIFSTSAAAFGGNAAYRHVDWYRGDPVIKSQSVRSACCRLRSCEFCLTLLRLLVGREDALVHESGEDVVAVCLLVFRGLAREDPNLLVLINFMQNFLVYQAAVSPH